VKFILFMQVHTKINEESLKSSTLVGSIQFNGKSSYPIKSSFIGPTSQTIDPLFSQGRATDQFS